MRSTVIVVLLSALFVATHIGLARTRVRSWFIARLGEKCWIWSYAALAAVLFSLMIGYYAGHQFDGPAGPNLGAIPAIRWMLIALVVGGIALMGCTFAHYLDSPYAVFTHNYRDPYGIERLTRHPFFAGMAVFAAAHALLSSSLNGTIVFSSLVVMAVGGARHQDAKLLQCGTETYRRFLSNTSGVPFVAIIAGRQRIVWHELPIFVLISGLALAAALHWVHDSIFAHGGVFVIAAVVGPAAILMLIGSLRSERRPGITGS